MEVGPLFDLRLRTPRFELRLPTLPEVEALREVALPATVNEAGARHQSFAESAPPDQSRVPGTRL